MAGNQKISIDDYANSMFRYDRLNQKWIDQCADYLKAIFGDRIHNAIVLDYAFGRGNWSLAFLKCGARKVISVDASENNVRRFSDYCRENSVRNIDIHHGNVMEDTLPYLVDIIWNYGILMCMPDPASFLKKLVELWRNKNGLSVIYSYDANSLRHAIVSWCREYVLYDSEEAFRRDSSLYTPAARLRVRDDLTAPIINWYTVREFAQLVAGQGFYPMARINDFGQFLGRHNLYQEFSPHLLLCAGVESSEFVPEEPLRNYAHDTEVVRQMLNVIALVCDRNETLARNISIGIANTHFSALACGGVEAALAEDFLILLYDLLHHGVSVDSLEASAKAHVELAVSALNDTKPRGIKGGRSGFLGAFLSENNIRL